MSRCPSQRLSPERLPGCEGIRSWLGVPLFMYGGCEGVIAVQSSRPGAFREDHQRLLESLALQIFHPDFFGGSWAYCPDSVDFGDVEGINIYEDKNAFYKQFEWRRVPTINSREINGQIRQTQMERNVFELVSGTRGRSGEQLDIWSAVFGPLGNDGYFEPLWDKKTGVINQKVADYWKENYDLRYYLEKNWSTVGPKVVDKIRVYTGDADNFFLNNSVRKLEEWMKKTRDPHYEGTFLYGAAKGHCWIGPVTQAERLKEMAQHMLGKMPRDAIANWWKP
ncbi:MAG: GAF domain-containing protein [Bryobacteraceae bacterium]